MQSDEITVRGTRYNFTHRWYLNLEGSWPDGGRWRTVKRRKDETLEKLQQRCEAMVADAEARSATWSHYLCWVRIAHAPCLDTQAALTSTPVASPLAPGVAGSTQSDEITVRGRQYNVPLPPRLLNLEGPWPTGEKWRTVRRRKDETLEELQQRCEAMVADAEVRSAT